MPTLIVEDGTAVANANSYVNLTYLNAYADDRGLVLPTEDNDKIKFLIAAVDVLEFYEDRYSGSIANDDQQLSWPRKDAYVRGVEIADDAIPKQLKNAQCQLVVEQQKGTRLWPTAVTSVSEGVVIEKTIAGALKKRFSGSSPQFNRMATPGVPIVISTVMTWLKPLISGSTKIVKRA